MKMAQRFVLGLCALLYAGAVWAQIGLPFPGPGAASGVQFFVASTGNNANPGTQASPWLDLTNVNSHTFGANDCVNMNGGNTFGGGTTGITSTTLRCVTSYGTGQATISTGNSASCLTATNIPVNYNNFICLGGGTTSSTTQGIVLTNSSGAQINGVLINNVTVSQYGGDCLFMVSTNNFGYSNFTISNTTLHDCTGKVAPNGISAGINFNGFASPTPSKTQFTNFTLSNLTVYNTTGISSGATDPTGNGFYFANASNGVLTHSLFHDNGANGGVVGAGPGCGFINMADNITFSSNEAYNCLTGNGVDGDGLDFDDGVTNSTMEYNYVHDCVNYGIFGFAFVSGSQWGGNTFRYNVVANCGNGLGIIGSSPGVVTSFNAYGNTLIGAPLAVTGLVSAGTVANNVFYGITTVPDHIIEVGAGSTITMTGNDYWGNGDFLYNGTTYTTYASWQAATGQEKIAGVNVGKNVEPQLVTYGYHATTNGYNPSLLPQYQLQTSSGLLGGGIDITSVYGINIGGQDFYGQPLTSAAKLIGAGQTVAWTSGTGTCSQATSWLGRATGMDTAHQQRDNALLCGSDVDGNLAHLSALYKLAADTSAHAALNLVSTSFALSITGSPTFTANVGYTGNGTNSFIDTTFVPSTSGSLNSFSFGGYDLTSGGPGATDVPFMGSAATNDTDGASIWPLVDFTGPVTTFVPVNDPGGLTLANSQNAGLYAAIRTGSAAEALYKNGTQLGTGTTASTALPDQSLYLLSWHGIPVTDPSISSSDQGSHFFIGDGSINPTLLSWRINADAAALGINKF